jgi:hypothetical protein
MFLIVMAMTMRTSEGRTIAPFNTVTSQYSFLKHKFVLRTFYIKLMQNKNMSTAQYTAVRKR